MTRRLLASLLSASLAVVPVAPAFAQDATGPTGDTGAQSDQGSQGDQGGPSDRNGQAPAEQAPPSSGNTPSDGSQTAAPDAERAEPDSAAGEVPALPAPPVSGGATQQDTTPPTRPNGTGATRGPASVADLAERLSGAVVNIATTQSIDQPGRGIPFPQAPEGSPLQDFFDQLLNDEDGLGTPEAESQGSGFVIDPSGIIVTNNHVIGDGDTITATFPDGTQLDAELIGVDDKTDLAILQVEPDEPLPSVAFGDSDTARIGDWVMAIGNPFGLGGSVSLGIVSARGRNINAGPYDNFIQTDAAINRGNSGGPLFDMNGNVVGINTAIISPTGGSIGIGFSVPSNLAVNVIDQLREYGETRRGWLGVRLRPLNEEIAEGLGIDSTDGAVVTEVIEGGPSDGGDSGNGLMTGDVITRFDGKPVTDSADLPRIVAETPVGKTVTVDILRKSEASEPAQPTSVEIMLGRLEDGEALLQAAGEGESGSGGSSPSAGQPEDEGTDGGEDGGEASSEATVLGMTLASIDDGLRQEFGLDGDAQGVVITEVAENSAAADKGIEAGTVIREVAQETVETPQAVVDALAGLREEGRRNALMLLQQPNGDLTFVVVPMG